MTAVLSRVLQMHYFVNMGVFGKLPTYPFLTN